MSTTNMDSDLEGKMVDQKTYRGMIESLLYLTATRPDIQFSVCLCARFQTCPLESHFAAIKRIFRYLVGTKDIGFWYPINCNLDLVAYTDSDFVGSKLDQKSTSGYCQILRGCLISWVSKKQHSVALSTTEAEYVTAGSCAA